MTLNRIQIAERRWHAQELLRPSAFRSWLQSLGKRSIVGDPGSYSHCPLANYLRAQMGGRPLVKGIRCRIAGGVWLETPVWARSFIALIDRRRTPISVKRALWLLDQVLDESRADTEVA